MIEDFKPEDVIDPREAFEGYESAAEEGDQYLLNPESRTARLPEGEDGETETTEQSWTEVHPNGSKEVLGG